MNPQDSKSPAGKKTEEDILDKQLEDSFPASDPPNLTRAPKDKRDQVQPPENTADRRTPAKDQNNTA